MLIGLTERGAHPSRAVRSERNAGRDEACERKDVLEPARPRSVRGAERARSGRVEPTETARAPLFLAASGRGDVRERRAAARVKKFAGGE